MLVMAGAVGVLHPPSLWGTGWLAARQGHTKKTATATQLLEAGHAGNTCRTHTRMDTNSQQAALTTLHNLAAHPASTALPMLASQHAATARWRHTRFVGQPQQHAGDNPLPT
jgi:hypothetical protein